MSRTKTGRCKANRRTRREKEGDGEEIERAGNDINTLRTGSFKLFKRPFPGFLTILKL